MQLTIHFRGEESLWKSLIRLEKRIKGTLEVSTQEMAEWVKNDIQTHWSAAPAPSKAGEAPAYDTDINTGVLNESVRVGTGRGAGGRFTGSDYVSSDVYINTANTSGNKGRGNYAQVLEFGRRNGAPMAARPFLQPAMERAAQQYPDLIKRVFYASDFGETAGE